MKNLLRTLTATSLLVGVLLAVTGCTARLPKPPAADARPDAHALRQDGRQHPGALPDAERPAEEAEDVSFLSELADPFGPGAIPVESSDQVEHFVARFTGPQKAWVGRALERSGRYRDRIWEIFREEGLPEELVYLALIESGYNPHAYSRSGAVGIWQFMEATGRRYGLVIDWWVDERRDLEKSTRAAAHYLKDLYALFEDWHLAAAAYNAGEGKLKRGLEQHGTGCYWNLSQKRYLAQETREYVPRFLAVVTIARDPQRYGFENLNYQAPLSYETVAIRHPMDLAVAAKACGADLDRLKALNPQLRRGCTPPNYPGPYEFQIPRGSRERFTAYCAGLKPEERLTFARHKVRGGETLSVIARRYGVPLDAVASLNGIKSRHSIREGQEIIVPLQARYAAPSVQAKRPAAPRATAAAQTEYRVRKGDTLWGIAGRHGVSVDALRAWNLLAASSTIHPGQKLVIRPRGPAEAQPVSTARLAADIAPGAPGPAGSANRVVYRVREGDTLWAIAGRHGVSVASVTRWNGLAASATIHPGQALDIWQKDTPQGRTAAPGAVALNDTPSLPPVHTVREGDTLWNISRRYGVSLSDLCRWNDIDTAQPLRPGMRLQLAPRIGLHPDTEEPAARQLAAFEAAP